MFFWMTLSLQITLDKVHFPSTALVEGFLLPFVMLGGMMRAEVVKS